MSTSRDPVAGTHRRLTTAGRVLSALSRHAWFVEDEVVGLIDWVKPGDVCIDIGAEYGLYTVALAARVGPDGKVYSIEPQPDATRILDLAVQLAGAAEIVTTYGLALAEEEGQDLLSVPRRRGLPVHGRAYLSGSATGPGPNVEFDSSRLVPVEVTTLDQFCADQDIARVDVIKADVEGAELKVLRGGVDTLSRDHPAIQLEIENPHIAKYGAGAADVVEFLQDLGYGMRCWDNGTWRPADRVTDAFRNYLFVASTPSWALRRYREAINDSIG